MTIVKIFGDGTTIPQLTAQMPIISINNGFIDFGCFLLDSYKKNNDFLLKPLNYTEIEKDVKQYIEQECAFLLQKRHPVYLLCPVFLSKRMIYI